MFDKVYELPIAKSYVAHWGMAHGVRELIQNAIDSDSPFEYEWGEDSLILRSRHSILTPQSLLLGTSSKTGKEDKIGSFGEGYKIAMLVLLREGYQVIIRNGDKIWTPQFKHSKTFGTEMLCILETDAKYKGEGLEIQVAGLSAADKATIESSCIMMQAHIGQVIDTTMGQIMLERKGQLYVGGLFICTTDLEYGYNFKPNYIRLERDRQTVDNLDLKFVTKEIWFKTERWKQIAELMEKKIPDLQYANYGCPELVKEECYQRFTEKYPDQVLAESPEELKTLVEEKMVKTVYTGGGAFTSVVRSHRNHVVPSLAPRPKAKPIDILNSFYEQNKKHMRKDALVAWKAVIAQAKDWTA